MGNGGPIKVNTSLIPSDLRYFIAPKLDPSFSEEVDPMFLTDAALTSMYTRMLNGVPLGTSVDPTTTVAFYTPDNMGLWEISAPKTDHVEMSMEAFGMSVSSDAGNFPGGTAFRVKANRPNGKVVTLRWKGPAGVPGEVITLTSWNTTPVGAGVVDVIVAYRDTREGGTYGAVTTETLPWNVAAGTFTLTPAESYLSVCEISIQIPDATEFYFSAISGKFDVYEGLARNGDVLVTASSALVTVRLGTGFGSIPDLWDPREWSFGRLCGAFTDNTRLFCYSPFFHNSSPGAITNYSAPLTPAGFGAVMEEDAEYMFPKLIPFSGRRFTVGGLLDDRFPPGVFLTGDGYGYGVKGRDIMFVGQPSDSWSDKLVDGVNTGRDSSHLPEKFSALGLDLTDNILIKDFVTIGQVVHAAEGQITAGSWVLIKGFNVQFYEVLPGGGMEFNLSPFETENTTGSVTIGLAVDYYRIPNFLKPYQIK